MKVKTFCNVCADWYNVDIVGTDDEILFTGTVKEARTSNYANKIIKQIIINKLENFD